jgi:hypothetical protein
MERHGTWIWSLPNWFCVRSFQDGRVVFIAAASLILSDLKIQELERETEDAAIIAGEE